MSNLARISLISASSLLIKAELPPRARRKAEELGSSLPFPVIPGNAHSIRRAPQSDFVLLDCPPGNAQIIDTAVAASDEVIIPVSPSGIEVDRMRDALDLTAEKPTRVLLA
ncbi:AAA family ATPase [Corynebacterium pseudotuberculosis Cp162]|nr:AAA family ATPase [Corynebacterium pseudotuberculosis Cp162]